MNVAMGGPALAAAVEGADSATFRLRPGTDTFVFDLDDTLYPRAAGLYAQMLARVVLYIQELTGCERDAAVALHARYYEDYGTSLVGLTRHHGVKPQDFLAFVHTIDLSALDVSAELSAALAALPGRRIVFTNGSAAHAERVLGRLGIADLFEGVCDIAACGYVGKPERAAYETLLERHGIVPERSVMFDDRAVNLLIPHALGMQTVLIGDHGLPEPADAAHVHFRADSLMPLLALAGGLAVPNDQKINLPQE
ncbi:pyrimidine 5'-nucleotidase [Xanthobacter sp. KR7-65]|uniref:pyrimidine 5'-nucleotidase n=1 Tax=Xanthobacter sp. KR7-65 TaxID=3156612 RepID=UPI0032B536F6